MRAAGVLRAWRREQLRQRVKAQLRGMVQAWSGARLRHRSWRGEAGPLREHECDGANAGEAMMDGQAVALPAAAVLRQAQQAQV